jgi:hypothetical protein
VPNSCDNVLTLTTAETTPNYEAFDVVATIQDLEQQIADTKKLRDGTDQRGVGLETTQIHSQSAEIAYLRTVQLQLIEQEYLNARAVDFSKLPFQIDDIQLGLNDRRIIIHVSANDSIFIEDVLTGIQAVQALADVADSEKHKRKGSFREQLLSFFRIPKDNPSLVDRNKLQRLSEIIGEGFLQPTLLNDYFTVYRSLYGSNTRLDLEKYRITNWPDLFRSYNEVFAVLDNPGFDQTARDSSLEAFGKWRIAAKRYLYIAAEGKAPNSALLPVMELNYFANLAMASHVASQGGFAVNTGEYLLKIQDDGNLAFNDHQVPISLINALNKIRARFNTAVVSYRERLRSDGVQWRQINQYTLDYWPKIAFGSIGNCIGALYKPFNPHLVAELVNEIFWGLELLGYNIDFKSLNDLKKAYREKVSR